MTGASEVAITPVVREMGLSVPRWFGGDRKSGSYVALVDMLASVHPHTVRFAPPCLYYHLFSFELQLSIARETAEQLLSWTRFFTK